MSWASLVRSLPNQDRKRLGAVDDTTKAILRAYNDAHNELVREILKGLPKGASEAQIRSWALTQTQSAAKLKFITDRLAELDSAVGDKIASATAKMNDLAVEQAPAEAKALKLLVPSTLGPDPRVIESILPAILKNLSGWNRTYRNELLRSIAASQVKGETYTQLSSRLHSLSSFNNRPSPYARATAHALSNARWLLVRANNEGRQAAYQQIGQANDVVIQKAWWSAIGSCCTSCALMHGQVVDLGDNFDWKGVHTPVEPYLGLLPCPPMHPACRCRILPVTPDVLHLVLKARKESEKRVLALAA